jgi:DNA-binding beta-propeller fold protein YncE
VDTTPGVGAPPDQCGSAVPDLSQIVASKGIIVDPDGIIYYTRESNNQAYIGRLAPGQANQPSWFQLANGAGPRTLRLNVARGMLFVAASTTGVVFVVGFNSVPVRIVGSQGPLPGAHGLAVAPDGSVFMSTSDGLIYRGVFDLANASKAPAITTPVFPSGQRPLGLAFGPDGLLYVGSSNGRIKRFRVENNMLVQGQDYGSFSGPANDLAFDVDGRLYVSASAGTTRGLLSIIASDGSVSTTGMDGLLGGMSFGRGALPCQDLYVCDAGGVVRRYQAPGLALKLP